MHLPDMLRVVLSVKAGTIRPSIILRKLGTYSRRNKLYQAFRELGNVVRTEFLLHLLGDPDLRSTLQSAMNKSEAFNGFAKWALFGGEGVITENRREEQRKIIKFNHLVANCVILYNVFVVSIDGPDGNIYISNQDTNIVTRYCGPGSAHGSGTVMRLPLPLTNYPAGTFIPPANQILRYRQSDGTPDHKPFIDIAGQSKSRVYNPEFMALVTVPVSRKE